MTPWCSPLSSLQTVDLAVPLREMLTFLLPLAAPEESSPASLGTPAVRSWQEEQLSVRAARKFSANIGGLPERPEVLRCLGQEMAFEALAAARSEALGLLL